MQLIKQHLPGCPHQGRGNREVECTPLLPDIRRCQVYGHFHPGRLHADILDCRLDPLVSLPHGTIRQTDKEKHPLSIRHGPAGTHFNLDRLRIYAEDGTCICFNEHMLSIVFVTSTLRLIVHFPGKKSPIKTELISMCPSALNNRAKKSFCSN